MGRKKNKKTPVETDEKKGWWQRKSKLGKTLFVFEMIALTLVVSFAGFYTYVNMADAKRRAKLTQVDEETGRPESAVMYEGKWYVRDPDIISVLFLGIDSYSAISEAYMVPSQFGQADVILVAAIDGNKGTMKMINIPRDTMAEVSVYDKKGYYIKSMREQVCLQYAFGTDDETCRQLMEQVMSEQILKGVTFDHCVAVNYGAVNTIVDELGGVSVTMTSDWTVGGKTYAAGDTVNLTGTQAEEFLRFRDTSVMGSNLTRLSRQADFLSALYSETSSQIRSNPAMVGTLYSSITQNMNTDLSVADATNLATTAVGAEFSVEDSIIMLPGEMSEGVGPDNKVHDQYEVDEESVKKIVLETFYKEWIEEEKK